METIKRTLLLMLLPLALYSQDKQSAISLSCYVNPELYLKAGVISFVSDQAGKPACSGSYVTIYNGNKTPFFFKLPGSSGWKQVTSIQQVIVPIAKRPQGLTKISMQVKYQEDKSNSIESKVKIIAKMNAAADAGKASVPPKKEPATRVARAITPAARKIAPQEQQPKEAGTEKRNVTQNQKNKDLAKKTALRLAAEKRRLAELAKANLLKNKTPESTCFYSSDTAYYTFFYIKLRDSVLYSDPFPVEQYQDDETGEKLLSKAWGCLSDKLIGQFGEDKYNELLDDVDFDLMNGLQHLRNPQIPSWTIVNDYPYTRTYQSTEEEIKKWIRFDSQKTRGIKIIKVNFP